jgi:hypothetical protein
MFNKLEAFLVYLGEIRKSRFLNVDDVVWRKDTKK